MKRLTSTLSCLFKSEYGDIFETVKKFEEKVRLILRCYKIIILITESSFNVLMLST